LKKRTKKLLDFGARLATGADRRNKSFLLLFFKKEVLLPFFVHRRNPPMSLERNLILSVCMVLVVSLLAGATLTYEHAASRVRTEINAALAVGRSIAQYAVADSADQTDPDRRLGRIVGAFNGDRHLRAVLIDGSGRILLQSALQAPQDPAPAVLVNLLTGPKVMASVDLPPDLSQRGTLQLRTDAHNEISEAWDDIKLDLSILGIFFCLVLGLVVRTLRRALRPLQDLCAAFTRVGAGDYSTRLAWRNTKELAPVHDGFNAMAERLADMERQTRLLQTRVQCVQEEERGELARDLHDEVAPFLFAVSADASLIRQFVASNHWAGIDARAEGILSSVSHMQKHLRHVLSRLMPDVLLDLGLAGAIETLVHFWNSRRPDIAFTLHVDADSLDDRRTAVAFRVVQESLSNAVRHADPSKIDIRVEQTGDGCIIEVQDNGTGMSKEPNAEGLGLLGMRERVNAVGGRLVIKTLAGSKGVAIQAFLSPETVAFAA
jgi:two-component system sensor histidine kinase UhpB